jgi:L-seryl-tRNA(Ser) seleniumtransferase
VSDQRHTIPPVNRLLAEAAERGLADRAPRPVLLNAIRAVLDDARDRGGTAPATGWLAEVEKRLAEIQRPSLRRVINATGVVLHTNLGRAPLAAAAVDAMVEAARYSTLEYDLEAGARGSRQAHVRTLIREITGAEDAIAVNNAAAAMVLVLNTLAHGGETLVSRGELVEIGGAFRIPEILGRSGTVLIEVGTTNKTRIEDYERSLSPRTACALKVHRSNFSLSGFTSEAPLLDLVNLMEPRGLPVIHDVGSGLLVDLAPYGLHGEPLVVDSVAAGAVAVFSGDKLVGGPQSGIVAGPARFLRHIAQNPLARALRPDKMVLAGLAATLAAYRDPDGAVRSIPTLRMLTTPLATLSDRAARLRALLSGSTLEAGTSSVGGGSFPQAQMDTTLVAMATHEPEALLERLRAGDPPVVARAAEGRILLDPRTLFDDEIDAVASVVMRAIQPR